MNKAQQKLVRYGNLIAAVVRGMEAEQEALNPKFEQLRTAIDEDKLADINADDYAATKSAFAEGTATYQQQLDSLTTADAPARLMGNHKLLVAAYTDFVAGCQAMTDSLGKDKASLDVAAFNAAEQAQDAATEQIMKHLQRVSQLA